MQGGDNGEAEAQHNNGLEGIDEPPLPTLARENVIKIQENEVDMREEGGTGEKRGLSECGERLGNDKLQRREGIKQSLRDITPVSYEEYDDSWDLEDQSKKCKKAANCLLASCDCRCKSEPIIDEREDMLVHLPPNTVAELGRKAVAVHPALIQSLSSSNTGRYSNTAAGLSAAATYDSSNPTTGTVSQLNRKSGRIQSSWSKRV